MMLALSFATPLLLIGALAAGIPWVLHLLSSVRAQDMMFPTLRFLRMSMEKTARRRRLQHWLLLLLRTALFALFAISVAEPIRYIHVVVGAPDNRYRTDLEFIIRTHHPYPVRLPQGRPGNLHDVRHLNTVNLDAHIGPEDQWMSPLGIGLQLERVLDGDEQSCHTPLGFEVRHEPFYGADTEGILTPG